MINYLMTNNCKLTIFHTYQINSLQLQNAFKNIK